MTLKLPLRLMKQHCAANGLLEKLTTFAPKMRSAINLVLSEQIHDAVNTVPKRKALEKRLIATTKPVIDGTNPRTTKRHH